jgi:hypothetical protein
MARRRAGDSALRCWAVSRAPFLRQLLYPIGMDRRPYSRIEPDLAQVIKLLNQPSQGPKAWAPGD